MEAEVVKLIAAGAAVAIGGIAPALAQGLMARQAFESMGRNPSVKDDLFTKMIIAMVLTESIAIYSLVIALLILFV